MAKTIMVMNGACSALMLALKAQEVEIDVQVVKATQVPYEMLLGNGSLVEFAAAPHYPTEKVKSFEWPPCYPTDDEVKSLAPCYPHEPTPAARAITKNGGRGHSKQFGYSGKTFGKTQLLIEDIKGFGFSDADAADLLTAAEFDEFYVGKFTNE